MNWIKTIALLLLLGSLFQKGYSQSESIEIPPAEVEFYLEMLNSPFLLDQLSNESIFIDNQDTQQVTEYEKFYRFTNTGRNRDVMFINVSVKFKVKKQ